MLTIDLRQPFSLDQTFSCGQCFRWKQLAPEVWQGIAFGRCVSLSRQGSTLLADCDRVTFDAIWRPYLDLDRDYETIRRQISIEAHMAEAAAFGSGIHILSQEPWEALCAFIVSQCNNIPRISGIMDRLCRLYGKPCGEDAFAFPSPEGLAAIRTEDLSSTTRCGYRAAYLTAAARAVAEGKLDLYALSKMDTDCARTALLALPGVGIKVANCVLLFGLHKLDAFPVDVWMRRILREYYGDKFDAAATFGPYAGIAQQYLFYYARSGPVFQTLHA